MGYIEEEDDMEEEADASETEDAGETDASQRRRKASLSGSDSDGSTDRRTSMMHWGYRSSATTTPRASASSRATTPRAFTPSRACRTPRELIARLGYPTPLSGDGDTIQELGAATMRRAPAGGSSRGSGGGGGGNSTDESWSGRVRSTESGSDSGENTRRKSFGRRASVGPPVVGSGVKLGAEAAAILNADSPRPREVDDSAGRSRSKSTPGAGERKPEPSVPPNSGQIITRNATTSGAPVFTVPPNPRETITRNATAPDAPLPIVDGPGSQGGARKLMPRSTSLSADRPLALDRPVTPRWMEVCMYSSCECFISGGTVGWCCARRDRC